MGHFLKRKKRELGDRMSNSLKEEQSYMISRNMVIKGEQVKRHQLHQKGQRLVAP